MIRCMFYCYLSCAYTTLFLFRGALIELSVDGSGSQRHFHNLAHWAGKAYYNPQCSNPVDVQGVINVVKTAINNMNLESY
jgi:hypothetical protein